VSPEILNIAGHKFLEDCGLEGTTHPGKGKTIKIFRNAALGIDIFGGNGRNNKPTAQSTTEATTEPTTQQTTQQTTTKQVSDTTAPAPLTH
jgi:hypothetical protein